MAAEHQTRAGTNVLNFLDGGGQEVNTCGLGPQGADGYQVLRKNLKVQLLWLCL